jgi:hypothetical protein
MRTIRDRPRLCTVIREFGCQLGCHQAADDIALPTAAYGFQGPDQFTNQRFRISIALSGK